MVVLSSAADGSPTQATSNSISENISEGGGTYDQEEKVKFEI